MILGNFMISLNKLSRRQGSSHNLPSGGIRTAPSLNEGVEFGRGQASATDAITRQWSLGPHSASSLSADAVTD